MLLTLGTEDSGNPSARRWKARWTRPASCHQDTPAVDTRKPFVASGIRRARRPSPRGMTGSRDEADCGLHREVYRAVADEEKLAGIKEQVKAFTAAFPLSADLIHEAE
jgi:glycine/serine hydroxymethyltransferase